MNKSYLRMFRRILLCLALGFFQTAAAEDFEKDLDKILNDTSKSEFESVKAIEAVRFRFLAGAVQDGKSVETSEQEFQLALYSRIPALLLNGTRQDRTVGIISIFSASHSIKIPSDLADLILGQIQVIFDRGSLHPDHRLQAFKLFAKFREAFPDLVKEKRYSFFVKLVEAAISEVISKSILKSGGPYERLGIVLKERATLLVNSVMATQSSAKAQSNLIHSDFSKTVTGLNSLGRERSRSVARGIAEDLKTILKELPLDDESLSVYEVFLNSPDFLIETTIKCLDQMVERMTPAERAAVAVTPLGKRLLRTRLDLHLRRPSDFDRLGLAADVYYRDCLPTIYDEIYKGYFEFLRRDPKNLAQLVAAFNRSNEDPPYIYAFLDYSGAMSDDEFQNFLKANPKVSGFIQTRVLSIEYLSLFGRNSRMTESIQELFRRPGMEKYFKNERYQAERKSWNEWTVEARAHWQRMTKHQDFRAISSEPYRTGRLLGRWMKEVSFDELRLLNVKNKLEDEKQVLWNAGVTDGILDYLINGWNSEYWNGGQWVHQIIRKAENE